MKIDPQFRLLLVAALLSVFPASVFAQEADKEKKPKEAAADEDGKKARPAGPVARYITVSHPVNEQVFTRVRNSLVKLQNIADQEDRDAFLILEIERGTSTFGQVHDLAKELTSFSYSRVRTVAWIPEHEDNRPLDGYALSLIHI
mgnify:FL=1